jgi:hypothetical protein
MSNKVKSGTHHSSSVRLQLEAQLMSEASRIQSAEDAAQPSA